MPRNVTRAGPPRFAHLAERAGRRLAIKSALIAIVMGTLLVFAAPTMRESLLPADSVSLEELSAAEPSELLGRFVEVRGETVVDTGKTDSRRVKGRVVLSAEYLVLESGRGRVLVRVPPENKDAVQSGRIESPGPNERLILRELGDGEFGADRPLPAVYVDVRSSIAPGVIALLLVGLPFAFAVFMVWTGLQRMRDPRRTAAFRHLSEGIPPADVVSVVDAQLAEQDAWQSSAIFVTSKLLVVVGSTNVHAIQLADLAWANRLTIASRIWGIIPAGSHDHIVWHRTDAKRFYVRSKRDEIDGALEALADRAPWAVIGTNDAIVRAWKRDREGFLAGVAARRDGTA